MHAIAYFRSRLLHASFLLAQVRGDSASNRGQSADQFNHIRFRAAYFNDSTTNSAAFFAAFLCRCFLFTFLLPSAQSQIALITIQSTLWSALETYSPAPSISP